MRMLQPLCSRWSYGSGTDAHPDHAHQELMRTRSIRISSLSACSACASVFLFSNVYFVNPQHARKEIMHALSMRVRNWCVHWACMSGAGACTEHTCQVLMCAQSAFPSKSAEFLMHTLSIRVRNWCVRWAYESGADAYPEHTHQFLMRLCMLLIWKGPFKACWACE